MSPNAAETSHDAPPSDDKILRLSLDAFEGPLDLLLHLIRKHQLDIFDIPIAFVTEEYLKYLEDAAKDDLGVAGEYLVMASTLLQIKSAMLLPKPEKDDDDEDDEDPREALIRRLLAFQSFKDAAEKIAARDRLFRDVFPRPETPDRPQPPRTVEDIDPPTVFDLVEAFQALIRAKRNPPVHEVTRHELSIKDSILRMAKFLDDTPRTTFEHLVSIAPHEYIAHRAVITFMGLLEMAKLRLITLFQARLRSDNLIVERAVLALEEIALQLDFSDPDLSNTPDVAKTEEAPHKNAALPPPKDETHARDSADQHAADAHQENDEHPPIPILPAQDDDALMSERRVAMRGRPRYIPPETLLQQSEDEDQELLALSKLHAELDNYDLDAVLAQALALSQIDASPDDEPQNPSEAEATQLSAPAPHIDHASTSEDAPQEHAPSTRDATQQKPSTSPEDAS